MPKKKITDKIKENLTPEDLKVFEEAVDNMVKEKVDERVSLREEEMKAQYDKIAEEYVAKTVAEELEKEKAKIVESYDAKLNTLEKKIVTKLDAFMEHVISEQISDEAIEKIAMNEALLPVVDGVKKVFAANHIEINSDGEKVVKEATQKAEELEGQLSEQIAKNLELEERLENTASYLLIAEKTSGLTESQKQRVVKMFKGKNFEEVKEKIDTFVEMVKESSEKKVVKEDKKEEKPTVDEVIDEKDTLKEEKKEVPVKPEDTDKNELVETANRWV